MRETGNAGPVTIPASGELRGPGRTTSLKAFAVSLSYANLCFLDLWSRLQSRYFDYFRERPPERLPMFVTLSAALLDVLLLACVVWAAWRFLRHTRIAQILGPFVFLLLLLVPLNVLRTQYHVVSSAAALRSPVALGACAALAFAIVRWRRKAAAGAAAVVLALTPLFPIEAGQAAWRIVSLREAGFAPRKPAGRLPAPPPSPVRAVWVIFDELDYRIAFAERPGGLRLPEFDRLQSQALAATRVERAQRETLNALPSLIAGRVVRDVQVLPPDGLRIAFQNSEKPEILPGIPTVFSRARAAGFNTAVSGWYHPYCRMFASELSACACAAPESQLYSDVAPAGTPLAGQMLRLFRNQAAKIPGFVHFGLVPEPSYVYDPVVNRRSQIREYETIHDAALRFASDPSLGLVFIHWPVPHSFGIYTRQTGQITDRGGDYLDNLALADRTLGELRSAMEKSGVWDSSVVLVSSDHSLRIPENSGFARFGQGELAALAETEAPWVPFFLKMPHEDRAVSYAGKVNAVASGDLLLSVLAGKVATPEDAARWLDGRGHPGN